MSAARRKPPRESSRKPAQRCGAPSREPVGLRIIGGKFRRRKLHYSGDPRTRPMKDRLREAVFNLLGPAVVGTHAIDLFAGTGALGFEALSRGAIRATLVEQHRPTAQSLHRSAAELDVAAVVAVAATDVWLWLRRRGDLGPEPWVVFCSPPYDFYVERQAEMLRLIGELLDAAPAGSLFVVEADARFDFGLLPRPDAWEVRRYSPAVVGIFEKRACPDIHDPSTIVKP